MNHSIKLQPWMVPNYALGVMPAGQRQDGLKLDGPKWHLSELAPDVLSAMCDEFRAEVFRKAGKPDPRAERQEP